MRTSLKTLRTDRKGASAAEYALILAVLGGITLSGAQLVGTGISDVFTTGKAPLDAV
jgi:Flp pilus assembly pilin Flp